MQLSLLLKASVLHYKNDTRKGNGSRGNFEILKSIKNKPISSYDSQPVRTICVYYTRSLKIYRNMNGFLFNQALQLTKRYCVESSSNYVNTLFRKSY